MFYSIPKAFLLINQLAGTYGGGSCTSFACAPCGARFGTGQASVESSIVFPILLGNLSPGLYSLNDIFYLQ